MNIKRVVLFVLTMLYVFLMPRIGFSIATFLLIFLGIIVLSDGKTTVFVRAFFVALLCTVVGYVSFIHLFKTRFPFGPVENLIKGWLQ